MDHLAILKRMWQMLWRYRALWVFGVILALTAASGSGGQNSIQFSGGGNNGQGLDLTPPPGIEAEMERLTEALERFFESGNWAAIPIYFTAFFVALCCVGLLLAVVATVARHVAEAALIRMVDAYEATGEMKTVPQGFRMGWSRAAWRLFLIGLVVGIPVAIGALLLIVLAGLPLLAWTTRNTTLGVFGTIVAIGLLFLVILVLIAVSLVTTVLVRLAWRAAALDNLGVFEAIRRSWALMRRQWKDVGLMWLIMLGVNLGYGILSIPVVLILLLIAGVAGGLIFGIFWVLVGLFTDGALPWIVGALMGAPVFFALMFVPLTFLTALHDIYESGVWTLTYRELRALEALAVDDDVDIAPDKPFDVDVDIDENDDVDLDPDTVPR